MYFWFNGDLNYVAKAIDVNLRWIIKFTLIKIFTFELSGRHSPTEKQARNPICSPASGSDTMCEWKITIPWFLSVYLTEEFLKSSPQIL